MKDTAPGELELVRLFVNTIDLEDGIDALASPADLAAWLETHGLARGISATDADLEAARRLREAIRDLLLENNGGHAREESAAILSETAERAGLALRFEAAGRARLEPAASGVDAALGRLVAIAAGAMGEGTWSLLKACRAHPCGWAFYDHARNRSRRWCSMAVCGNRTKARSYRARRAA